MADRRGRLAGTTAAAARIYYNDDGEWKELPGIGQMELTPDSSQSSTYSAFEGAFAVSGTPEIGQATFEINSLMPHHPGWKFMEAARQAKRDVQLRAETPNTVIFTADKKAMVAIAKAGGAVTFSGSGSGSAATDLEAAARGHCFRIGAKLYTIESISDADTPVFACEPPAADVAAATYSVVWPIMRWSISGGIATYGGATLAEDAATSGQMVIQPRVSVPPAVIAAEHTIS